MIYIHMFVSLLLTNVNSHVFTKYTHVKSHALLPTVVGNAFNKRTGKLQ